MAPRPVLQNGKKKLSRTRQRATPSAVIAQELPPTFIRPAKGDGLGPGPDSRSAVWSTKQGLSQVFDASLHYGSGTLLCRSYSKMKDLCTCAPNRMVTTEVNLQNQFCFPSGILIHKCSSCFSFLDTFENFYSLPFVSEHFIYTCLCTFQGNTRK